MSNDNGDSPDREVTTPAKPEVAIMKFPSLELLSLYTTMMLKRLVLTGTSPRKNLPGLIKVVDHNIERLKINKRDFFKTLRDHTRLCHNEWDSFDKKGTTNKGRQRFNTYLMIFVLKAGIEELLPSDGGIDPNSQLMEEELRAMYSPQRPSFNLKVLNQTIQHQDFRFFFQHSDNLEEIYLPFSYNNIFQETLKFRNLRHIEFGGGMPDKVLCSIFFGTNKKSEKLLELNFRKNKAESEISLGFPHLTTLKCMCDNYQAEMIRVSFGAALLFFQPHMEVVEAADLHNSYMSWDTCHCITYILRTELKYRKSVQQKIPIKLAVKNLDIHSIEDMSLVKQIVDACPQLNCLTLDEERNPDARDYFDQPDIILKGLHSQVNCIQKLSFEVTNVTYMTILSAYLLKHCSKVQELVLRCTPDSVIDMTIDWRTDDDLQSLGTFHVTKLLLEFVIWDNYTSGTGVDFSPTDMLDFLQFFPAVKDLSIHSTVFVPAEFLVYGCVSGALATMHDLKHLSVLMCPEDLPLSLPSFDSSMGCLLVHTHQKMVTALLPRLMDEATFKHLKALKSFLIDEFFLSKELDSMLESLRMAGVVVSVHYRWNAHTKNDESKNYDAFLSFIRENLLKMPQQDDDMNPLALVENKSTLEKKTSVKKSSSF